MHQHYVGLDVHSKQSVYVIADAAGTRVAEGEVPTTPAGLTELRDQHAWHRTHRWLWRPGRVRSLSRAS